MAASQRVPDRGATGHRHVAFVREQALHGQMDRHKGRGARGAHRDGRPPQVEQERDSGGEVVGTRAEVGGQGGALISIPPVG
jgi:hypothetical protein